MPIRIEARYLSGNDMGKRIIGKDVDGEPFRGTLDYLQAASYGVTIGITGEHRVHVLKPHDTVTLNGNMKPAGEQ